jgi:hypothetical protein
MRRHDSQQQPRAATVGTYAPPENPHAGDPTIEWILEFLSPHLDAHGRAIIACARPIATASRCVVRSAWRVMYSAVKRSSTAKR